MLTLKSISKTFNPHTVNEKKALDRFSLHLDPGEFVTVIGSNGAGKSTVMNAVAGVFLVDAGQILLDGEDITFMKDYRRARQIGRLFQDPLSGTAPSMTIEENLSLAYLRTAEHVSPFGLSAKDRAYLRERLAALGLGLEDRLSTRVGLLSGGQRQALTLLMATLKKPKLLLLDEHTAALDPRTAAKVLQLSRQIVEENHLMTMMVTHNMKDAIAYGNRLIMMHEGRVILDIKGEQKKHLTVEMLLEQFARASGDEFVNDRALLG